MEIRQLKAFLAIAEAKTFTAGARRVNVTQAAISMQIRQLEDEVGLQLFTRTPRRVILTEAGEYLLERARKILREHDSALAEIAEIAGAEYGHLRDAPAAGDHAEVERDLSERRVDGCVRHERKARRQDHARRDRHRFHLA